MLQRLAHAGATHVSLRFGEDWTFEVGGAGPLALHLVGSDGQLVAVVRIPGSGDVVVASGSILPGTYTLVLVREVPTGRDPIATLRCDVVGARRELGVAHLAHAWQ